jgi:glycosyltransferase involved in cell wall biosynthesis
VQHRVTGLLVPPQNPDGLADAITTLLGDKELRIRLGRAARQRIVKGYTLEYMLESTEALYERLIGLKPSRKTSRERSAIASPDENRN